MSLPLAKRRTAARAATRPVPAPPRNLHLALGPFRRPLDRVVVSLLAVYTPARRASSLIGIGLRHQTSAACFRIAKVFPRGPSPWLPIPYRGRRSNSDRV